MCIPGALCITQNKEAFKHAEVQLPLIIIDDDSTVSIKLAPFSTHIDMLRFYENKKKKRTDMKLDSVIETAHLYGDTSLQSLNNYCIKRGYSERKLRIINTAMNGILTIPSALSILMEDDLNSGNQNSATTTSDETS